MAAVIAALRIVNELLSAGIAITAFSLLLYALSFNLRDRVARSFAIILVCVVVVYVGEAIGSATNAPAEMQFWLRAQWIGLIFLPPAYIHFSDALLATTGRPSRGRRRRVIWLTYLTSSFFLLTLLFSWLVGPLVQRADPAPHLQRTWLTWVFSAYYALVMTWAWINFLRASRRTLSRTSRRRVRYLLLGALAPTLGTFPYLLFGAGIASRHPLAFWLAASASNLAVAVLLVIMAYAVAFFGVPWPDRVVKRRLFKWLMRGPVTASSVLAITTIAKRAGEYFSLAYQEAVPILMVGSVLILEHLITLVAPYWERWLFHGGDRKGIHLVQTLEERMLTSSDLREFLEAVLAAACDRLQVDRSFVVALTPKGLEKIIAIGDDQPFLTAAASEELLQVTGRNGGPGIEPGGRLRLFNWKDYWLAPLTGRGDQVGTLLGMLGVARPNFGALEEEHAEALFLLAQRAAMALDEHQKQQAVFSTLETLAPEVDLIQRLRAAARYDGTEVLTGPDLPLEDSDLARWVKEALSHFWGGPKLSQSPLLRLLVVQRASLEHEGNLTNGLRAILRAAMDRVKPEGERRFTAEWILYNILELKFMEGRKVSEIARRLAMSEADLYRKQRVAIEAVARAILAMEQEAREEQPEKNQLTLT
jgi:hypothetical protein